MDNLNHFSIGERVEISAFHLKLNHCEGTVTGKVMKDGETYYRVKLIEIAGKPSGSYHIPKRCLTSMKGSNPAVYQPSENLNTSSFQYSAAVSARKR